MAEEQTGMAQALALHRQGKPREAALAYLAFLQRTPDCAAAYNCLGLALVDLGRMNDALAAYDQALVHQPVFPEVLNNRGNALQRLGKLEPAVESYRQAIALWPHYVEAYSNLGVALLSQGRFAAAIAAQRQAIGLNPRFPQAHNNLGKALLEVGQLDESVAAFRQALALRPDYPEAENNLANVLESLGQIGEALALYEGVLARRPDFAEIHLNYAMCLLRLGRFHQGWDEYEWRWKTRRFTGCRVGEERPEWTGEALAGRRILLYPEQGLGDMLQFCRFVPLVAERGGRVILRVQPALRRLLASLPGLTEIVSAQDPLPDSDLVLPLMSVPRVIGLDLAEIPCRIPYLTADPALVIRWRQALAEKGDDAAPGLLRVGLVWAGNPRPYDMEAHLMDQQRSLRLEQLAPLADLPGVRLVSLQKGAAAVQAKRAGLPLLDVMDGVGDFADTAALVAAVDLVISVDTSVVHLAGAMGKPVWVLSRFDGCWRWLGRRGDSPWYPTARLFHQDTPGDWSGVVAQITQALQERLSRS